MSLPEAVAAIVFDFDGVLVDSADAYISTLSEMVAPVDRADWPKLYGMTTEEAADYAAGGTIPDARLQQLGLEIDRKVGQLLAGNPPARVGADPFVRRIHELGIAAAVASSASRAAIDGTVAALGWRSFFAAIVGRDNAPRAKPFPDIYAEAVRQLNVAPERAVAIEDTHIGILSARGAGLSVIALGGTQSPDDLAAADAFFPGFDELTASAWFQSLLRRAGAR